MRKRRKQKSYIKDQEKIKTMLEANMSNKDIKKELKLRGTSIIVYYRKKYNIYRPKKEKPLPVKQVKAMRTGLPIELISKAGAKYSQKKRNAKLIGVEFDISFYDVKWNTHCPVLGIPLNYDSTYNALRDDAASFDRIDPNKGYVKGNVCIISMKANMLKRNATVDDLKKVIKYIEDNSTLPTNTENIL